MSYKQNKGQIIKIIKKVKKMKIKKNIQRL